ncbi:hypothetical protein D3C85_1388750 [compost metagenome]
MARRNRWRTDSSALASSCFTSGPITSLRYWAMIWKRLLRMAMAVSMSRLPLPSTRWAMGATRCTLASPSRLNSLIQAQPMSNSHFFTDSLAELG